MPNKEYNEIYYKNNRENLRAYAKEYYKLHYIPKKGKAYKARLKKKEEKIDAWQIKILLQKYKIEEIENLTMLQALQLIAENLKK